MSILAVLITILILIVIHELGHFFVAKKFNIKVLEFGFGIPPKAIGKKVGETLITLNWLPLGGFVRLLGEDDLSKNDPEYKRSFVAQPVSKRIAVVIAGVVMNLLLAWILFYIYLGAQNFQAQLPLLTPHHFAMVNQHNETMILVGLVEKNSPASQAGLKVGDRILFFNGAPVQNVDQVINEAKSHEGQPVSLTLSNPDKSNERSVSLVPRINPAKNQGAIGIALKPFDSASLTFATPTQKVLAGPIFSYNLMAYQFDVMGDLISKSFQRKSAAPVSDAVAGPVGITSLLGEIITGPEPILNYLYFLGLLSLSLAFFNVLPIPPMDGGRLFFLLFEAVTRRKVHVNIEKYSQAVGFAVLVGILILITVSDVRKLF